MIKTKIAILGAGASGLFLAKHLKKDFLLVDSHEIPRKIKISGGGKCNFTNEFVSKENYLGDKNLIEKVLKHYSNKDVLSFFNDIKYKKLKNNQYFASNSSEIIKKLNQKKLIANIINVQKKDNFIIHTSRGDIQAQKVIVATGGVSYKKTGATDIGYNIAKSFGHSIENLSPSLVGLTLQKDQFWMKNLSGVSTKAVFRVGDKTFKDYILFSHKGITGPAVLNTSLYWKKGSIVIDFLPDFIIPKSNKTISNLLPLPKRFMTEFLKAHNFPDLNILKSKKILQLLRNYEFSPAGTFGFEKAEVTRGGVKTSELNGFESKIVSGLYFIGEVLNVTGELGGYNFQWCFSSAKYVADDLLTN